MAVLTRCPGGYTSQLEMFEVVAAHEIAEAATDPSWEVGPAWDMYVGQMQAYQASVWNQEEMTNGVEIGDLCILTRVQDGAVEYQRVFSNIAAQQGGDPCVPALPIPYFNVSPDPATNGWIQVSAGQTLDVQLSAWSTAPTQDWIVVAHGLVPAGGQFPAQLTSPTSVTLGGVTYNTTNNGRTLTLHVTIPADVSPGWWGAVRLWSAHRDANSNFVPGEDIDHEGLVGFYVPLQ
jgi:hypothetical protein